MEYICSGAEKQDILEVYSLLREPIPACSRFTEPKNEQAFFMPVSSVHVGRGIIKLVWGVNGVSYQGRLCGMLAKTQGDCCREW